ncbi:hypothetical protein CIPAW_13G155900 [Carya illinoinensis]|uniref:Uncharacterized protein n=1 Tax=Carya illinoinensis TaxID=32201 RepID=A0A8T1NLA9_CARIL|nr:hypothetical protein CIPAW_13G155900 [Carya illinoinensis]
MMKLSRKNLNHHLCPRHWLWWVDSAVVPSAWDNPSSSVLCCDKRNTRLWRDFFQLMDHVMWLGFSIENLSSFRDTLTVVSLLLLALHLMYLVVPVYLFSGTHC